MGKHTLTSYRLLLRRSTLIPVAALLALVILAISPRSITAPNLSFDRAKESKRPKTPKNVVRADPAHTSNGERPGKGVKPDLSNNTSQESHDVQARLAFASPVPAEASRELTKPGYLRSGGASPPYAGLAPPV